MPMTKWTTEAIRRSKGKQKLAVLTAYDWTTAKLLDEAGMAIVLVGDSLAMTALGYETTLPVTLAEMLHHTAAVSRGVKHALVVGDMPFLSYQVSIDEAVLNAGRFIKEGGAAAVKIEGGAFRKPVIEALVANGIPVMGHIGLTPQSVNQFGGYRVQGNNAEAAQKLIADAQALEAAGVFSIVIECVPASVAADITAAVHVPTIGIGAGVNCDGQVLVSHDLLGLPTAHRPRFVKTYANLEPTLRSAFESYRRDVESGTFPAPEHGY